MRHLTGRPSGRALARTPFGARCWRLVRSLKKVAMFVSLIIVCMVLVLPGVGFCGDGKCTYLLLQNRIFDEYIFTCTADDAGKYTGADGTNAVTTRESIEGIVVMLASNPGAYTLTDNWDLTMKEDGADVLGGTGADRDTANSERWFPKDVSGGSTGSVLVNGPLSVAITNNSQPNAIVVIKLRGFFR